MYTLLTTYTIKDETRYILEEQFVDRWQLLARNLIPSLPDDDSVLAELIKNYNGFINLLPNVQGSYKVINTPFNVIYSLLAPKYKQLPDIYEFKLGKTRVVFNYNKSVLLNLFMLIGATLEHGISQFKKLSTPPSIKRLGELNQNNSYFGFKIQIGLYTDELFYPITSTNHNFITAATDKASAFNLDFDLTNIAFTIKAGFFDGQLVMQRELSESVVYVTNYTLGKAIRLANFALRPDVLTCLVYELGHDAVKIDSLRSKQIEYITKVVLS